MDCKQCSGSGPEAETNRKNWGCDEPAEVPLLAATCWRCSGYDPESCDLCKGAGMVDIDRCPRAMPDSVHWQICEYVTLIEVGILPVAGGLEDQSASFLEALRFTQGLKVELDEVNQPKAGPPGG